MTTRKARLAEVYDQPPDSYGDFDPWGRHFCVQLDGVWQLRLLFKRRCDASRWAGRRARRVKHWYMI